MTPSRIQTAWCAVAVVELAARELERSETHLDDQPYIAAE
jgi:hypothetical protein